MPSDKIVVGKCYETATGELRLVTAITITGDVIFTSCQHSPGYSSVEGEHMLGEVFAQDAEREVPKSQALQAA